MVSKADNVFKCKKRSYKLRGHNCCFGVGTHPGTPGRYAAGLSTSQTEPWRETQRGGPREGNMLRLYKVKIMAI